MVPSWITNWLTSSGIAVQALVTLLFSGCLAGATTGCAFQMDDKGTLRIGYQSSSFIVIEHEAQQTTGHAMSSTELSEPLANWLFDADGQQIASPADPPAKKVGVPKKKGDP